MIFFGLFLAGSRPSNSSEPMLISTTLRGEIMRVPRTKDSKRSSTQFHGMETTGSRHLRIERASSGTLAQRDGRPVSVEEA